MKVKVKKSVLHSNETGGARPHGYLFIDQDVLVSEIFSRKKTTVAGREGTKLRH